MAAFLAQCAAHPMKGLINTDPILYLHPCVHACRTTYFELTASGKESLERLLQTLEMKQTEYYSLPIRQCCKDNAKYYSQSQLYGSLLDHL